jgi:phosphatidylglycerophosphate synthase
MPETAADTDIRISATRRTGWAIAITAVAIGSYFIGAHIESGKGRFTAAVWQAPLSVPGSPASWGAIILIAGLLQVTGRVLARRRGDARGRGWVHWGCILAFLWACFVDGAQLVSLWNDDRNMVNALGLILWTLLAYLYGERAKQTAKRFYA